MVSESLTWADEDQDTVRKHPVPAPLTTRWQEGRSGKQEPCPHESGGATEGAVLSKPRVSLAETRMGDLTAGCRERCRSLFGLCSGEYPME